MTHSEILLLLAIVGGFALLALTVGAFALTRPRLGVVLLVLAGVAFISALVLMSRVSSQWEVEKRHQVTAKYDVHVAEWGAPLGSAPEWKVNGKTTKDCVVTFPSPNDPKFVCDGEELPLR